MRVINRLLAGVAISAGLFFNPAMAAVKIGEAAPDFKAQGSNGKSYSLSEFKGKYVVLEWTNDGCPFVRKHYSSGNMQKLQKEATDQGTVWLSVVSSAPGKQGNVSAAEANALSKSRKAAPTAVLLDENGSLGKLYEAKTTPHMFIVDPQGKLIYNGAIDDTSSADPDDIATSKNYVRTALAEAATGKPVSKPLTQPYGCSIKY